MTRTGSATRLRRALVLAATLALGVGEAAAWPATLMESLSRDARRLLPASLARLIAEREPQILEEVWRFPPPLSQALAADLAAGRLQPETLAALEARASEAVDLIRQKRVSDGIVRLGSLLRVPADLSDPVLSAGPDGFPPGVAREYYAFVELSRPKIPVVLDDEAALKLGRRDLAAYWQRLLSRSREQSAVIPTEMFQRGRLVSHRTLDYRSPVFGVASLSYSRAVTAIAATWLAVWRDVRGDLTRRPTPTEVRPTERPATPTMPATPAPRAPSSEPGGP
jgi:hypothetical protein